MNQNVESLSISDSQPMSPTTSNSVSLNKDTDEVIYVSQPMEPTTQVAPAAGESAEKSLPVRIGGKYLQGKP